MTNIVCFTQDIPGERDWLKDHFCNFNYLETKSSGLWSKADLTRNNLFEIPHTDINDLTSINQSIVNTKIKTIFSNKINSSALFDNTYWTEATDSLIHNSINFEENKNILSSYMMFTFGRCGTVFTESILRKRYQQLDKHYGLDLNPSSMADRCADPSLLICLIYRKNWWNWAVSTAISQDHGFYHYDDNINWESLSKVNIDANRLDTLTKILNGVFNFWCNLRIKYPSHTFKLFHFEDIIKNNQDKTPHKKITYNSADLIANYTKSKELFEKMYLPQWQTMEANALAHLKKMKVEFTDIV